MFPHGGRLEEMQLKVICKRLGKCHLSSLFVGDEILCSDSKYHPVLSIITYSCNYYEMKLSNFKKYDIPENFKMQTTEAFDFPKQDDVIVISKKEAPIVMELQKGFLKELFYDILIDVPMITTDGIIFKFGGSDG